MINRCAEYFPPEAAAKVEPIDPIHTCIEKPIRMDAMFDHEFAALHVRAWGHDYVFIGCRNNAYDLCVEATARAVACAKSGMKGFSYVHAALMNRFIRAVCDQ
jgi:hypothetical protein